MDCYFDANDSSENHFRFVAIQNPDAPRDPAQKRLARSHAVKNALRVKRERQEKSNINFQILYPSLVITPHRSAAPVPEGSLPPLGALSDTHNPFEMLAVDSSRLKSLLSKCKSLSICGVFTETKSFDYTNNTCYRCG